MTFETQYTEEDFLKALDYEKIRSVKVIMVAVGCSRNTAMVMLNKLEYEGKIKKIVIEGSGFGYVRVKQE